MGPRGVWDHIHERRVGCGDVLKGERDFTTDVDTVIAVVTSIAKRFTKVKQLRIIDRYTEIMWNWSGTQMQINLGVWIKCVYPSCHLCHGDMIKNRKTQSDKIFV